MRMVLVLLILVATVAFLNGCCPLSCMLIGSKKSTAAKQEAPMKSTQGDKKPGKPVEKSSDQSQ